MTDQAPVTYAGPPRVLSGVQPSGAPGASDGVRRGPVTGANIGIFESRMKAAGASCSPAPGVCTGLADFVLPGAGVLERFMNGR